MLGIRNQLDKDKYAFRISVDFKSGFVAKQIFFRSLIAHCLLLIIYHLLISTVTFYQVIFTFSLITFYV